MTATTHKLQIANLAELGEFELRGHTYSGPYLSMLVRVDPSQPIDESARTPQLIQELAYLTAVAGYESEIADLDYRVWRDKQILRLTTDLDYVQKVMKDEDIEKCLTKTAAEVVVRTIAAYKKHYQKKAKASEVHAILHGAFEAAKARQRAVYAYEGTQGGGVTYTPDEPAYDYGEDGLPERGKTAQLQAEVLAMDTARTPIPEPNGEVPGPPGSAPAEPPTKKRPPAPPGKKTT